MGQPIKDIIKVLNAGDHVEFDSKKHEVYLVCIVESPLRKVESYLNADWRAIDLKQLGNLKKIKQLCLQLDGAIYKI